jgi:hypothetical protein
MSINQPLKYAYDLYTKNGNDFSEIIGWYLENGVVVSSPRCFMLAYFCKKDDIKTIVPLEESNCVYVTICVGDMREAGKQIVEMAEYIAYQREFKGSSKIRITNFKNFYQKLKWAH